MAVFRRMDWQIGLFFLFFIVLIRFMWTYFPVDGGTFQHIVMGETILHDGLIYHEPYTFTMANVPWISHGWLAEIIMALLNRLGGLDSLLMMSLVLMAGLFTWMGMLFIRKGYHPVVVLLLLCMLLFSVFPHIIIRPLLFTMIGMVLTQYALIAYETKQCSLKTLLWLIPGYWVWSNAHPGALGGMCLLELTLLGWIVWRMLGLQSPLDSLKTTLQCQCVVLLCVVTAFMGPYGVKLPAMWWHMIHQHLEFFIVEWYPFYVMYSNPACLMFLAVFILYIVAILSVPCVRWRVVWLTPLFLGIQGFLHIRQESLFTLLAGLTLMDVWPHIYEPRETRIHRPLVRPLLACVIVTMLFLCALQVMHRATPFNPDDWPIDMIEVLQENEPKQLGAVGRLFNEFIQGGFVLYYAPHYKLFINDHVELFGEAFVLQYLEARDKAKTASFMKQWQQQYGLFDYALARQDGAFAGYFDANPTVWGCKKRGKAFNFYTRLRSPNGIGVN